MIFLLASAKNNSFYSLPLYTGVYNELVNKGFRRGEGEILATNLPVLNILSFLGANFYSTDIRLHKWL